MPARLSGSRPDLGEGMGEFPIAGAARIPWFLVEKRLRVRLLRLARLAGLMMTPLLTLVAADYFALGLLAG
jgi:hypothetical protein